MDHYSERKPDTQGFFYPPGEEPETLQNHKKNPNQPAFSNMDHYSEKNPNTQNIDLCPEHSPHTPGFLNSQGEPKLRRLPQHTDHYSERNPTEPNGTSFLEHGPLFGEGTQTIFWASSKTTTKIIRRRTQTNQGSLDTSRHSEKSPHIPEQPRRTRTPQASSTHRPLSGVARLTCFL